MGVGGTGLLSTIVATPMVIGLEIGAVVCGVGSVISKFISRRLSVKARKHDSIRVLCMSKLDAISVLVSAAFTVCKISYDEFRLIMDEVKNIPPDEVQYKDPSC